MIFVILVCVNSEHMRQEHLQYLSVLDCVAPCLEESLLSLAKLRREEVWKSFTEHIKCVDVWLKNDSEKGP